MACISVILGIFSSRASSFRLEIKKEILAVERYCLVVKLEKTIGTIWPENWPGKNYVKIKSPSSWFPLCRGY
jgi:hypothetical protein